MMKNILSLIFIALAVGTYYVYISPEYQKIKTLRVEESQYLEAQANAQELTRVYDRLATEYNSLDQADIDRLNTFLPDTFDSTRFAVDIDALASRYSIRLNEVQTAQTNTQVSSKESLPVKVNTVTIRFKASYQSAVQFIKDVERSLNLIDITRVSFFADDKGVYDFTVSLQTYSLNGK